jgi:hypothetical protein
MAGALSGGQMSNRLVVIYTAGPGEANIIRELLAAAGIPAELSREGAGAAYGLTVGPMGTVDILVAEADAAAAQEVLDAVERGDFDDRLA